ncbi:MAG: hypothetical protein IIT93_01490 [Paludibacteraceae bacterium]|nr:hypothetical protein [Paludibacteraceae bacterium]MBQ2064826.1 hypothetical protein [Paludibacteraceae bacterium]MBQ5524172.1 hypothetical protein [Paludibacteraceae bacterium]
MDDSTPKKRHKKRNWLIPLSIVAVIAVVIFLLGSYASKMLSSVVKDRLQAQSESMHGTFTYGELDVNLWRAAVNVTDLNYKLDTTGIKPNGIAGYEIGIRRAEFVFLRYWTYLLKKNVDINRVALYDITSDMSIYDMPPAQKHEDEASKDTLTSGTIAVSQKLLEFVAAINVEKVAVNNASFKLKSTTSKLDLSVDSLFLDVENLGYDFSDNKLHYNDSVYICSLRNLYFVQPDGKYTLTVKSFDTKNAGEIKISGVHHVCNVPKEELAEVNGKIPAVWSDVSINSLKTSKVNIVRSVVEGYVKLDSVNIAGGYASIYKDDTYPPVVVQRPFQPLLAKITIPLDVRTVNVALDKFSYTQKSKGFPASSLGMNNLSLYMHRISNIDKRDMVALMSTSLDGGGGYMTINLRLLKDDESTWRCRVFIENSKMSAFNPFIEKLSGANVSGNLKRLEGYFTGDTLNAKGEFVMEYDSLDAKILKGKSPIPQLNKYANTINGIIKLMLPRSNPSKPDQAPKAFKVDAKRNLYKPYFVYIISPMFCGIEETMLQGLFLAKEIHSSEHISIGGGKSAKQAHKDAVKAEREVARAEKKAAKEAKSKSKKSK